MFSAHDDYYEIKDNKLNIIDSVEYIWSWDYISPSSMRTDININGEPADSLKSIETKYTIIEDSYYEIPY